ncbi:hypothetical protein VTG60DRAFT_5038 [Thermothelomyces hinnuleus]
MTNSPERGVSRCRRPSSSTISRPAVTSTYSAWYGWKWAGGGLCPARATRRGCARSKVTSKAKDRCACARIRVVMPPSNLSVIVLFCPVRIGEESGEEGGILVFVVGGGGVSTTNSFHLNRRRMGFAKPYPVTTMPSYGSRLRLMVVVAAILCVSQGFRTLV